MANHSTAPKGTYFKASERNSVQYSIEFTKTQHDWLVRTASARRCAIAKVIKEMIHANIQQELDNAVRTIPGDASGQRTEAELHT